MLRAIFCGAFALAACFGDKPAPEKAPPVLSSAPKAETKQPVADIPAVQTPDAASANPVVTVAPDREPNDTPQEAIVLAPGQTATGFIAEPDDPKARRGDQDWYAIEVKGQSPMTAKVSVEGADDLDIVLEYMDPKPRRRGRYRAIVQADVIQKKPGPEVLVGLRLEPGKHYFRVRQAWYRRKPRKGSLSPYRLSHSLSPFSPRADTEPNNRPKNASEGTFDRSFEGLIGHRGDRDLWAVRLPSDMAGQRVRVHLAPFGNAMMTLAIAAPGRPELGSAVNGTAANPIELRNVYVPEGLADDARVLYVKVGARAKAASVTDPYRVTVSPETALVAGAVSEREPNDDFEIATPVTTVASASQPQVFYGYIDHARDEDVFRIDLGKPANLSVSLTPPLDSDLSVHIHGVDGHVSSAEHTARGQSEMVRGLALKPGMWHVVVKRQSGQVSTKAAYALQLELLDTAGLESEPNDNATGPLKSLEPGKPAKGWLYPVRDRDFWAVTVGDDNQGRIATFRLNLPPGLVAKAGIYKADGTVLTIAERLVANATFTHFLQSGTYHLQVWAASPTSSDAQTPYTLTLLK